MTEREKLEQIQEEFERQGELTTREVFIDKLGRIPDQAEMQRYSHCSCDDRNDPQSFRHYFWKNEEMFRMAIDLPKLCVIVLVNEDFNPSRLITRN